MRDIRSVNRLYVDNLKPPDIGETAEILVKISVNFNMNTIYIYTLCLSVNMILLFYPGYGDVTFMTHHDFGFVFLVFLTLRKSYLYI